MSNTRALIYGVDSDVSACECVADLVRSAGLTAKTLASGEEFPAARRPKPMVLSVRILVCLCTAAAAWCQEASSTTPDLASSKPPQASDKRILGIIPNYRTNPAQGQYEPITAREKFKIGTEDSFDRGTFALAAVVAAQDQLSNSNASFGQGTEGYAHRFVTSYSDWVIGDYMTEAIFPAALHLDPRYFRRGEGGVWKRLGSAVGQIFWIRKDSGGHTFNVAEFGGNAVAAAIGNAYYPDNRSASDTLNRLGTQVGLDVTGNILKEFWPDLRRAFHRHQDRTSADLRH